MSGLNYFSGENWRAIIEKLVVAEKCKTKRKNFAVTIFFWFMFFIVIKNSYSCSKFAINIGLQMNIAFVNGFVNKQSRLFS